MTDASRFRAALTAGLFALAVGIGFVSLSDPAAAQGHGYGQSRGHGGSYGRHGGSSRFGYSGGHGTLLRPPWRFSSQPRARGRSQTLLRRPWRLRKTGLLTLLRLQRTMTAAIEATKRALMDARRDTVNGEHLLRPRRGRPTSSRPLTLRGRAVQRF